MELTLLSEADAPALWTFETTHRAYFEQWVNPRGDTFYTAEGFAKSLHSALAQQARGEVFHYGIWEGGALAGRINLTQVRRGAFQSASLGYRLDPTRSGQGLASRAVAAVVQKAFHSHRLQRLEATARPENPASVRVLLKNGFQQFGHSRHAIQLQGQWFDLLCFEVHAQAPAALPGTAHAV